MKFAQESLPWISPCPAAIMLAQLLEKHGLRARVVSADAIAISNISRLETSGIVMVCLSYLDIGSPAHMRYAIRRLRRKLHARRAVTTRKGRTGRLNRRKATSLPQSCRRPAMPLWRRWRM
jgi:hypothetical protein